MNDEEWQERLKALVQATERKRAARAELRAELARRRAYGLRQRHNAKLARKTDDPKGPS